MVRTVEVVSVMTVICEAPRMMTVRRSSACTAFDDVSICIHPRQAESIANKHCLFHGYLAQW